ncbi:HAD family hydrolase [Rhodobacteraceae bacterium NNCM2]|nr:HAD family hydrolase [Coraliihabitans acroporae]
MMDRQFSAILFDKDGTLFDFHATWASVAESVLSELTDDAATRHMLAQLGGYDLEARKFSAGAALVAGSLGEIAALWAQHLPGWEIAAIEELADRVAIEAASSGALVPAVPDLPALLEELRAAGFRLGIATHDTHASTVVQIEQVGATAAFDFVAGYDSGHGLKPGPGMLLAFAQAVGVPPAEIVMVGDSVGDLAMVESAGAGLAVGVLSGPATRLDLTPHADHVIETIGELPALLGHAAPAMPRG